MKPFYLKKRLGQHFLKNTKLIERILSVINPQMMDCLIEIGPGLGALTFPLLSHVKNLHVVELDRDFIPTLQSKSYQLKLGNLIIHQANALKFDFKQLYDRNNPLRLVGNLPYNISTPLLFRLLQYDTEIIKDFHFMLQQEVVDRIIAKPGTKAYGRLSVMIQHQCHIDALFSVGPENFYPPPQVNSAFIRIIPYKILPFPVKNSQILSNVVSAAFNQRRKTLRNSLQSFLSIEQLQCLNIHPTQRAEELSVEAYVRMANLLSSIQKLKHE